jgi:hypothetical protein
MLPKHHKDGSMLRDCKNLTSLFRDRLLSMVRAWV